MKTSPRSTLLLLSMGMTFVLLASVGVKGCGGKVGNDVCLACHDGRTAVDRRDFLLTKHKDVDCEMCHGPGAVHVRDGGSLGLYIINPGKLSFDELVSFCGDCHEEQTDQYLTSHHAIEKGANCESCHQVHKVDGMRRSFVDNSMCLECHEECGFGDDAAIEAHTVFHNVDPAGTGASRCAACHMPPLDRVAQANGPHDHTWFTIPPIRSNEAAGEGISPVPPNSCSGIAGCHDGTVPGVPVFDVDNPAINLVVQDLYEEVGLAPGPCDLGR